jgi:hypothetical protein
MEVIFALNNYLNFTNCDIRTAPKLPGPLFRFTIPENMAVKGIWH